MEISSTLTQKIYVDFYMFMQNKILQLTLSWMAKSRRFQ